jgi:transposase
MLCDFYGRVLIEPQQVDHNAGHFGLAIGLVDQAREQHHLADLIVAIERTGNYHLPVKRAFAQAGWECRIVHPFATKQFRQPADPGNKTDVTDLMAIFRAAVNGFGLIEHNLDTTSRELRMLARHRRDLVSKRSALCCQMREHLDAMLPGYAACFEDPWKCQMAMELARHYATPQAIVEAGGLGLAVLLRQRERRFQTPMLERIVAWARSAAAPDADATLHQRILIALDDDRSAKTGQIAALERDLARPLARTPYVLLLSAPGINVISAAELAGEMGPIEHYANARAITGRAGLFPSRYQSDEVDRQDGSLIRCANRSLRAALLMVADNLRKCNAHYRGLAQLWQLSEKHAERIRIKIASRFTRVLYQMVAGRQVFCHPALRQRDYVLEKLLKFQTEHQVPPEQVLSNLQSAAEQLPVTEHRLEAAPLVEELLRVRAAKRGPQPLAEILPLVLAKLGVSDLQSECVRGSGPQLVNAGQSR